MKIGEVSRETGLSISNIRFYEKKGLLEPKRSQVSKYREYSKEDIERLKQIILLRKMDFSIEKIHDIFCENIPFTIVMKNQERELEKRISELKGALELCKKLETEESIQDLDLEYYMNYMIEQEKKGNSFAKISEVVEDFAEYSEVAFGNGMLFGLICSAGKYGNLVRWGLRLLWIITVIFMIYLIAIGKSSIGGALGITIGLLTMIVRYIGYKSVE